MSEKNIHVEGRLGLSVADVTEILSKYGPDVLQLIIEGLQNGLTKAFLQEVLSTLGKEVLGQVVACQKLNGPKATSGAVLCKPEEAARYFDGCCPELSPRVKGSALGHGACEKRSAPAPIISGTQTDNVDPNTTLVTWIIQELPVLLANEQFLQALLAGLLPLLTAKSAAVSKALVS